MSRATGHVFDMQGNEIAGFVYCGTSDISMSRLFPTSNEAWRAYRDALENERDYHEEMHAECNCGKEPTRVILHNTYGGGSYWRSTICMDCKAITSNYDPYDDNCEEKMCLKYGCLHWPTKEIPEVIKRAQECK